MITIQCGQCGKTFKVNEERSGLRLACTQCGAEIKVPESESRATSKRSSKTSDAAASLPVEVSDKPKSAKSNRRVLIERVIVGTLVVVLCLVLTIEWWARRSFSTTLAQLRSEMSKATDGSPLKSTELETLIAGSPDRSLRKMQREHLHILKWKGVLSSYYIRVKVKPQFQDVIGFDTIADDTGQPYSLVAEHESPAIENSADSGKELTAGNGAQGSAAVAPDAANRTKGKSWTSRPVTPVLNVIRGLMNRKRPRINTKAQPSYAEQVRHWNETTDLRKLAIVPAAQQDASNSGEQPPSLTVRELIEIVDRDDLTDLDQRMVSTRIMQLSRPLLFREAKNILSQLEGSSTNLWLRYMLSGAIHQLIGFDARNRGLQSGLSSRQSRREMEDHLRRAREAHLHAWHLKRNYPEAALELLDITGMIGGIVGDDVRFWLAEAVNAQSTFMPVYASFRRILYRRRSGNRDQLLQFGLECLATKRFDTRIPWEFHLAIKDIATRVVDGYSIFQEDAVVAGYEKMLSAYKKTTQDDSQKKYYDSILVCVLWSKGREREAAALLNELGDDVRADAFEELRVSLSAMRELLSYADSPNLLSRAFPRKLIGLKFDPTGQFLATGDFAANIVLWNVADGFSRGASIGISHSEQMRDFTFSPDGKTLALADFRVPQVQLWNTKTGNLEHTLQNKQVKRPFQRVQFSPDGKTIAAVTQNSEAVLWNVATRRVNAPVRLSAKSEPMLSLKFSADGKQLATAFEAGTYTVWSLSDQPNSSKDEFLSKKTQRQIGLIADFAVSRDGQLLIVSNDATATIYDASTFEPRLSGIPGSRVAFSVDGKRFATAGGTIIQSEIRVWDVATGNQLAAISGAHAKQVQFIAFSPDGSRLFSTGLDHTIKCWNVDSGAPILDLK